MPWFKVDDNLAFHAKAVAAGNAAMGLWVRAGSWCAQQLTDGFVPDHMIASLGNAGQARRLCEVVLWHRIVGGSDTEPQWHEVKPTDDCNVCLFINESGCVEELGHGRFVIAETPIRPIRESDGCDWEVVR